MATTLSTSIALALKATYTNSLDISDAVANLSKGFKDTLSNGADSDQADLAWWETRTVSNGSPDTLDLAGGLTDAFGQTLSFARLKGMLLHNKSGTAGEVLAVGGDTAAVVGWVGAADDVVRVGPNGILLLWNPSAAGYPVTGGSADVLQVAAEAGTIEYDIVLLGTTS